MRIAIASDHGGLTLKAELADWLAGEGHDVTDLGTNGTESVDYPDYGYRLAEEVASGRAERGIALCGSGIGISIAVNRNPACRCALVSEPLSAALGRQHNDANVIAMGGRLIGLDMAKACVTAFLDTQFGGSGPGGSRHVQRVGKLGKPPVPIA
jgi:ribose 5-phosphate isomerase B